MMDLDDDENEDNLIPIQLWPSAAERIIQREKREKAGFWIGAIVAGIAFLGLAMLAPPLAGWPAVTAIENAVGGFFIAYLGGLLGRKLSTSCFMGKDTGDSDYNSLDDAQDIDEEPESQKTRRNISFTIGFLIVGGLTGGLGFAFVLPLFTPSYLVWGAYALGCGFLALCGGKGTEIAMDNSDLCKRDDSNTEPSSDFEGSSTFTIKRAVDNNDPASSAAPLPEQEVNDNNRASTEPQYLAPDGDELDKRLSLGGDSRSKSR